MLTPHPYIQELLSIEKQFPDRMEFHANVKDLLLRMGSDKEFLKLIVKRNFSDSGYLNQKWSLYNIPFLYIYETDDFNLKIHLFPAAEHYKPGMAAHAIHHHNNYMLTTNAFFGSGYESMLFAKDVKVDENTLHASMKITRHFHQNDWNPSLVDAWEPHIVFIPEKLSATMLIWTPDKKRSTDTLRSNPLLKSIKKPIRKLIQLFGMEDNFGIARGKTYQFYPHKELNTFMAIEEEEYFSATKAAVGPTIDDYCMQILFSFLQRAELTDSDLLKSMLSAESTPKYYHSWIHKVLNGEKIQDAWHRTEINIPQKTYTSDDILRCNQA